MSEEIYNNSTVSIEIVKYGVKIVSIHDSTGSDAIGFVAFENIPNLISRITDIFIATKKNKKPEHIKIELGDMVYYDSAPMQNIKCEVVGIRGRKGVVQFVEIEGEFVGEKGRVQKMWVQVEYISLLK